MFILNCGSEFVIKLQFQEVLAIDLGDVINNVFIIEQIRFVNSFLFYAFTKRNFRAVDFSFFRRVWSRFTNTNGGMFTSWQFFDVISLVPLIPERRKTKNYTITKWTYIAIKNFLKPTSLLYKLLKS